MIAGPPGGVKPEAGPLLTASLLQTSFQFSRELYGCAEHNSRTAVILYQASQVALGVKNPPANAGDIRDVSSIPGLGRSPGGGRGNPLQCSCLENPMARGAWWAAVRGVAESDTTEVTKHTCTHAHTAYTHSLL